jgi:predicted RNA-binding Zn-ribbon protein involved in translation (DUF1610 family)
MDLSFQAGLTAAYTSSLQRIRILSEHWVATEVYCPNCGSAHIVRYATITRWATSIVLFARKTTSSKSQRTQFGAKVVDGAYRAIIKRLSSNTNPNLFLLNYDVRSVLVANLLIIPKHLPRRASGKITQITRIIARITRNGAWALRALGRLAALPRVPPHSSPCNPCPIRVIRVILAWYCRQHGFVPCERVVVSAVARRGYSTCQRRRAV